jgi:predicted small integral membrane protein
MQVYLKFVAQVLATVAAAVIALLNGADSPVASDWINVVVIALGSVAVLGAGNLPVGVWAHTKSIVAIATAVAVLLQSVITDGISAAEWLQLLMAALGAIGVYAVKGPVVETIAPNRRLR